MGIYKKTLKTSYVISKAMPSLRGIAFYIPLLKIRNERICLINFYKQYKMKNFLCFQKRFKNTIKIKWLSICIRISHQPVPNESLGFLYKKGNRLIALIRIE